MTQPTQQPLAAEQAAAKSITSTQRVPDSLAPEPIARQQTRSRLNALGRCPACHRGCDGWHGTRQRWTLRKMDEIKAINQTVKGAYA